MAMGKRRSSLLKTELLYDVTESALKRIVITKVAPTKELKQQA